MKIFFDNRNVTVFETDDSYRYKAVMGENTLNLKFLLSNFVDIPTGAWCEFEGERYVMGNKANVKKVHSALFEYNLTFEGEVSSLSKYKVFDIADRRLKFSMTAKPHEFVKLIVDNLNERESGWKVGTCLESVEKTTSFNHVYLSDGLKQVAELFETEFEVYNKTIHLRKTEYFRDNPLRLSYGRGNGFLSGIGRNADDKKRAVTRLYVQGGTRNIDSSKYKSQALLLPKAKVVRYDGAKFDWEAGFNPGIAKGYKTDGNGYFVEKDGVLSGSVFEDSLDLSSVYPMREGVVSGVSVVKEEKGFFDFTDASIPENLNFLNCLIAGETMTVVFQSGMLSGREFDVKYRHVGRKFEIVPQEIDGVLMPKGVFVPKVGDRYAVFNIALPDAYIQDDATKEGASWQMLKEAVKYLYENSVPRFVFSGQLDGIWSKRNWLNVGGKIRLGGSVLFTDNEFAPKGEMMRISGVKQYVTNPYSPEIEITNGLIKGSVVGSAIKKIEANEVVVDDKVSEVVNYTKRRFREAKETFEMLQDALLGDFSEAINPVAVKSMQLLLGDESLQFRFVRSKADRTPKSHAVGFDLATKVLTAEAGTLEHRTLGITDISSSHSHFLVWDMNVFHSPPLVVAEKKYYLYAKVPTGAGNGEFYLSETAKKIDAEAGFYYLLVGFLNSADEKGNRGFVSLYGFTEILPGRITTKKITSGDDTSYFDLEKNQLKLGELMDYNVSEPNVLLLKKGAEIGGWRIEKEEGKDFLASLASVTMEGAYKGKPRIHLDGDRGNITLLGEDYSYGTNNLIVTKLDKEGLKIEGLSSLKYTELSAKGIICTHGRTLPWSSTESNKPTLTLASVVGNNWGRIPNNYSRMAGQVTMTDFSSQDALAGVVGRAENSHENPAPSFGGLFEKLKAMGLTVSVKILFSESRYELKMTDVFINQVNQVKLLLVLPVKPYPGQIFMCAAEHNGQNEDFPYWVSENASHKIICNSKADSWVRCTKGRGDVGFVIFNGYNWVASYMGSN